MAETGQWINEKGNTCYGVNPEWKREQREKQKQKQKAEVKPNARKGTKLPE